VTGGPQAKVRRIDAPLFLRHFRRQTSFRDSERSDADNLTAAKVLARQALYEALRDNVRDDAVTAMFHLIILDAKRWPVWELTASIASRSIRRSTA
jgi:hypothetical protein